MRKIKTLLYVIAGFSLLLSSCTKDDPSDEPSDGEVLQLQGISDETKSAIPLDTGEIGLEIDARSLARIGYFPASADLIIEGSLNNYSEEGIAIDQYTQVATFKIRIEDLEEDVVNSFAEGVPIQVTIYDSQGMELESKSISRFIFNSTNKTLNIETEKPMVLKPLAINPSTPYYAAIGIDENTKVLGASLDYREGSPLEYWESGPVQLNAFYFSETPDPEKLIQLLYFIPQSNNTFAIRSSFMNSFLEVDENGVLNWNKANTDENYDWEGIQDRHLFFLDQVEDGTIKIKPYLTDTYLKLDPGNQIITSYFEEPSGTEPESYDLKFRLLGAEIEWEFESIDTKYSAPIIPPAKMDFAFDQTIINCSSSIGTYVVGTDSEETKTTTISYNEGINLAYSSTKSKSATVEAKASGTVFGIGVSVSASGTIGASATNKFGTSRAEQKSTLNKETQKVSTKRSIEVGPYTAIEVFDVIQRLSNVKIPFVSRFILRGKTSNGLPLTGAEIVSQMGASRFGGVISEVDSDYVIFNIRGSVNVDNYFEFNNTINDIIGACN